MAKFRDVNIDELAFEKGSRLVYFCHPTSGPCRTFEPQLVEFLDRLGFSDDAVLRVNTQGREDAASALGVMGVPALALVIDGKPREWLFGRLSDEFVLATLTRWKDILGS